MADEPIKLPPESKVFWYTTLNTFPFVFLPLVALVGVLCAIVMPYLTGVYEW